MLHGYASIHIIVGFPPRSSTGDRYSELVSKRKAESVSTSQTSIAKRYCKQLISSIASLRKRTSPAATASESERPTKVASFPYQDTNPSIIEDNMTQRKPVNPLNDLMTRILAEEAGYHKFSVRDAEFVVPGRYELISPLGKGAYGYVYLGLIISRVCINDVVCVRSRIDCYL